MSMKKILDISPLVSILIVSNNTLYLRETLTSICEQDYSNTEVILVLNGRATDEFPAVTDFFRKNSIEGKILICDTESIVDSKNQGLSNCKSEYICIIDSDDVMPINRISNQVDAFQADNELACLGGQLSVISLENQHNFNRYPTDSESTIHSLYRHASLPHPGVMFLKHHVLEVGGYRSTHPWIEDWDLWLRLIRVGKVYNLTSTTVHYRKHASQATHVHAKEIQVSTLNLLYENLEILISGISTFKIEEEDEWRHRVLIKSIVRLCFLKRPYLMGGKFGIREIRRALSGIVYQRYICDKLSGNTMRTLWSGLVTIALDPMVAAKKLMNSGK